mgnify:CR=1 FL=1
MNKTKTIFHKDGKIAFIRFNEVDNTSLEQMRKELKQVNSSNKMKVIESSEKDVIVFKVYR